MSFTKKQISNFLNNKILFRFSISDNNLINFEERKLILTIGIQFQIKRLLIFI